MAFKVYRQESIAFSIVALGVLALLLIANYRLSNSGMNSCMKIHTQNYCEKVAR